MIVSSRFSNSVGSSGVIPVALKFLLILVHKNPTWSLTDRLSTLNFGTEHLFKVSAIFSHMLLLCVDPFLVVWEGNGVKRQILGKKKISRRKYSSNKLNILIF